MVGRIEWNRPARPRFESGVDRGVFYPQQGPGVPWNGLTEVRESYVGGEQTAFHFDGVKYLDVIASRNFQAEITAFTVPRGFGRCDGETSLVPGFILTRQNRDRFGFSYRTLLGDGDGYQIHIVYNALAIPTKRGTKTLAPGTTPETRNWKISATPRSWPGRRPSAHFVVDSTKVDPFALVALESLLYGFELQEPHLPSIETLVGVINNSSPQIIQENAVSGYSPIVPGMGDLTTTDEPGIFRAIPGTRLTPTAVAGFYTLE